MPSPEQLESNHDDAPGATQRALGLYDIVKEVLSHLLPHATNDDMESGLNGMFDDERVSDDYYNDDADHDASTPGDDAWAAAEEAHALLHSAVLVNRLWFEAATPLLWLHPGEKALGPDDVPVHKRRQYYAAYIRHLSLATSDNLFEALAEHQRPGDIDSNDRQEGLSLPRLTVLRLGRYWYENLNTDHEARYRAVITAQASLLSHIGLSIKEMNCFLTVDLIHHLEDLQSAITSHSKGRSASDGGIVRSQSMGLRRILFYGRHYHNGNKVDKCCTDGSEEEERLLQWLKTSAPLLTSVRLLDVFRNSSSDTSPIGRAFRHLVYRPGLQQLWLGKTSSGPFPENDFVRHSVIQALAETTRSAHSSHKSGRHRFYDDEGNAKWGLPFVDLEDLYITIQSHAMQPLVTLLPSVTCLSVKIIDRTVAGIAARVLPPCSLLPQLKVLRLRLGCHTELSHSSFDTLKALTQLRELSIEASEAPAMTEAHLTRVLRCMPCLRTLTLRFEITRLTLSALLVVGKACPKLRRLDYPSDVDLAVVLDDVMLAPLFPAIETLFMGRTIFRHGDGLHGVILEDGQ